MVSLFFLTLLLSSQISAAVIPDQTSVDDVSTPSRSEYRQLLETLTEESLHGVLLAHLQPKFRPGVYEQNRQAVEAVERSNAPLATRLIMSAKLDMLRRQASNETVTVTTSTQTISPPIQSTLPTQSTQSTQLTQPTQSTLTSGSSSIIQTTTSAISTSESPQASSSPLPSTQPSSTTSAPTSNTSVTSSGTSSGNSATSSSQITSISSVSSKSLSPSVSSSIDSTSTVILSPSHTTTVVKNESSHSSETTPSIIRTSSSRVTMTSTGNQGEVVVATFTREQSWVSSLVLSTTTAENGKSSIVTSYADVVYTPSSTLNTLTQSESTQEARLQVGGGSNVQVGALLGLSLAVCLLGLGW